MKMAAYSHPNVLLLAAIIISCFANGAFSGFGESHCLRVPQSKFSGTVGSTIGAVRLVATTVSKFSSNVTDFRLNQAIADCLYLMDSTVDLLTSSLSVSRNPNGSNQGTGNAIADMTSWLSGALVNPDTCREGFDGTNNRLRTLISGGLDQITASVGKLLSMVNPEAAATSTGGGRKLIAKGHFPDWLQPDDRKLLQAAGGVAADAVVAVDGTGNFTSIQAAVEAAAEHSRTRYVIYVKRGVYKERVDIGGKKWNIMLMGDGIDATVISGSRSFAGGWTTFSTATFAVSGRGFIARDMTFENTAGPRNHQAVAFRSESDLSVLYRCGVRGFQDTLYPHKSRQFYRECKITGTVDFIFGHGTVVFQSCEITARKGLPNQTNTITANGRSKSSQDSGFSIQFCSIKGDPELLASPGLSTTYLGRPWKKYSRTVVMESYISDVIRPEGWLEWDGNSVLDTLYYGEYRNYGPGSGLGGRVNWPGYHVINDRAEAERFTVARFIAGNSWLPSTGVRYTAGLEI